ncbi:hypothetical protein BGX23_008193 [Mortierella sp. AD031]|nr:hypothetical protein BGX23_008193 [Mortierella sp. AD031]
MDGNGNTALRSPMIDRSSTPSTTISSSSSTSSPSSSAQFSSLSSATPSTLSSLFDNLSPLPEVAYIEYTKSPSGELKGVAISHRTILAQCQAISSSLASNPRRQLLRHKQQSTHLTPTSSSTDDDQVETLAVRSPSPLSPVRLILPSSRRQQDPADVVLSWLEPRQQVGLVLGGLLGVYRGSHTVFLHSGITETAGLWEKCAHQYGATLALGDYQGVCELIQARPPRISLATLSPSSSAASENDSSNLERLEAFLVDTVAVQPKVDLDFANKFLAPLGVLSAEQVVVPMASLPEHGGMIFSMRDHLSFPPGADKIDFGFLRDHREPQKQQEQPGSQQLLGGHAPDSDTRCYYLLDREALKTNWIEVLATGQDAIDRAADMGVLLVSVFGYASPQATLAIVDPETTALCLPNRVGEIWIDSPSIPFGFWNLPKRSQSTFHALPLIVPAVPPIDSGKAAIAVPEVYDPVPAGFLRTGLLAGLIEGRVVVFGHSEDRIQQDIPILNIEATQPEAYEAEQNNGIVSRTLVTEHHYGIDLVNTVLERIVGFSACTAFEYILNKEHVPVICAETPRCHQQADAIRLAEYVKQAMMDYHGLAPYCIAIAAPGSLPRTLCHGKSQIHPAACRKMLESGQLTLAYLWTSTEDTLLNLPIGDDIAGGIWGPDALAARGTIVPAHTQTIQYSSCDYPEEVPDEQTKANLSQFQSLADLLVWRCLMSPDEIAFQTLDDRQDSPHSFLPLQLQQQLPQQQPAGSKDSASVMSTKPWTFHKFGSKVVRIAAYIEKKGGFREGERVVLLFRTGSVDFIATLYAVWFLGLVPIPVPVPEPTRLFEDIALLMGLLSELGGITQVIGNSFTEEVIKSKAAQEQMKAFIGARQDTTIPSTLNISKASKTPKNKRALGQESGYLTPPKAALLRTAPALIAVHYSTDRRRTLVKMTHAGLMAQTRALKIQCQFQIGRPIVSCARTFVALDLILACAVGVYVGAPTVLIPYVDFETRPHLYFEAIEHHKVNPFITTRSSMNIEPVRLHVSLKALRRGLVEITTEQEDPTGIWIEDSGIPVCGTTVAIVNPETSETCLSGEIGEIWVSSEANVQPYIGRTSSSSLSGASATTDSMIEMIKNRFHARIISRTVDGSVGANGGKQQQLCSKTYARTGEIGFLWNYATPDFNGRQPTGVLFVLGPIGETFEVQGLLHFPSDVEHTIESVYPNFAPGGSFVFQAEEAVVCVVTVRQAHLQQQYADATGSTSTLMNQVLCVMHQVVDRHGFMPDVVALVAEGVLGKTRSREKQRGKMLSLFMSAKM